LSSQPSRQRAIASQMEDGMDECPPPEHTLTPFITGGDWSVGLNSTTSLDQVALLYAVGHRLRREYQNLVKAPLSERLTMLVDQLETGTPVPTEG
jgi:hypothetical protein